MFQEERGLELIQQMELKMHSYTRHAMIDLYSKLESKVAYIMGHTQPNIPAYVTRVLSGKQKNEQLCGSKERKGGKAGRAVPNTDCQKSIFSNSSIIILPVLFLFSFFL